MELTYAQKENIGFQYVLDSLRPCSPYGVEALRELKPFGPGQREALGRQLDNLGRMVARGGQDAPLRQLLRIFMGLKMVRPTAKKCLEADLNAIELFELKRFLLQTEEMLPLFAPVAEGLEGIRLRDTGAALDILDPEGSRVATFHIPDHLSPQLAQIRQEKREVEALIRMCPDPELLARRSALAGREETEEMVIHSRMSAALRPYMDGVLANMDAIGQLDLLAEKARVALRYGACQPELTENTLELVDMTNPRIRDLLQTKGKDFTPISVTLAPGATVITGANMGGKSVALKTMALNILLVHCGFFPFAAACRMPLFDGLHIISEDLESIDRGLSSFGGEMVRFNATIAKMETGFHFLLLDEFARGTNPHEGAAIVRSVTRYLNGRNAISVLATHYDHVADVAKAHYQVAGLKDLDWEALRLQIAGLEPQQRADRIVQYMNYGLYPMQQQPDCPRDALHICRLLGMPEDILEEAEKTVSAQ